MLSDSSEAEQVEEVIKLLRYIMLGYMCVSISGLSISNAKPATGTLVHNTDTQDHPSSHPPSQEGLTQVEPLFGVGYNYLYMPFRLTTINVRALISSYILNSDDGLASRC